MVLSCVVQGCNNNTNDPKCYNLKWHRLPSRLDSFHELKQMLKIPNEIEFHSKAFGYSRICSTCLNKAVTAKSQHGRKSPTRRSDFQSRAQQLYYTRAELRKAISHDHCYIQSYVPSTSLSCVGQKVVLMRNEPPAVPRCATSPALKRPEFCIEMIMSNDDEIRFYTSFPTYAHFMACFNFLGDASNRLIYPGTEIDPSNIPRTKTQRALTPKNEFFMTLCRLRCNLMEYDLAFQFNVNQSTVSRILTTWINFLYHKLSEIPIWPSRQQVQSSMPIQFRELYPSTHIIIDATEVYIQHPTNPTAQHLTFSTCKNYNTAKCPAGITPSGAFSFISPLYGGSISERELFIRFGLLDKLEPGDSVMADKGFTVADILESRGVTLNIPPRKGNQQLSDRALIETRRIATLRIHVERAFQRVTVFKIFNCISNNMAGLATEIFHVCTILTKFQPPLVMDK